MRDDDHCSNSEEEGAARVKVRYRRSIPVESSIALNLVRLVASLFEACVSTYNGILHLEANSP